MFAIHNDLYFVVFVLFVIPGRESRVPGYIPYIWSARHMPLSAYPLFQCDAMRLEASFSTSSSSIPALYGGSASPSLPAPLLGRMIFFASRLLADTIIPHSPFWGSFGFGYLSEFSLSRSSDLSRTYLLAFPFLLFYSPPLFRHRESSLDLNRSPCRACSFPLHSRIRRRWACPPEDSSSRSSGRAGPVSKSRYT